MGDGTVSYLDCVGGTKTVCQNLLNYILKRETLLYGSYAFLKNEREKAASGSQLKKKNCQYFFLVSLIFI